MHIQQHKQTYIQIYTHINHTTNHKHKYIQKTHTKTTQPTNTTKIHTRHTYIKKIHTQTRRNTNIHIRKHNTNSQNTTYIQKTKIPIKLYTTIQTRHIYKKWTQTIAE